MGRVDLNQLLRVIEGGCRFGEIDAVFPNVRLFLLGIPFNFTGSSHTRKIWDNVNIELQYNFVGNGLSAAVSTIMHKSRPRMIRPFQRSAREWSEWDLRHKGKAVTGNGEQAGTRASFNGAEGSAT